MRTSKRGLPGRIDSVLSAFREWPRWKRWTIGLPSVVVALVLLAGATDTLLSTGRIHPGVTVANISVGRMKPAEAEVELERVLLERATESIVLTFEEHEGIWASTDIAYVPDGEAMADEAMDVGRTGGLMTRVNERVAAWFKRADVPAVASSDRGLMDGFLMRVASAVDVEPKDASISIEGMEATIVPAVVGVSVRADAVESDMIAALGSADVRNVSLQVDFTPVSVTDEDAQQALADAKTFMSDGVTVVFEDQKWDFTSQEVATWIAFRAEIADPSVGDASAVDTETTTATADGSPQSEIAPGGDRMHLVAFISADAASSTIGPRVGAAGKAPVDARFTVDGDSVSVVPSQDGVGPDIEALAREMTRRLLVDRQRDVELRTTRVAPAITTEMAQGMGIVTRIGTYSTTYSSSNKPRVNNIHTLADALDGTLLAPGEVFSFNGTIGPRTSDKGYQAAPAIVDGELVPQLGGGICQIATTIFNAVYESGLPVVERSPHSLYISHYPTGRDAAVSWTSPDFKFKNDTADWVLIRAFYTDSSIRLSIYGPELGYEIKSVVGSWSVSKAFSTREVEDPTLPIGSRVVDDPGADGKKISVTRIVTKSGTEIRRDVFTSVYKPEEEVVRVGTMPVSEPVTGTLTPAL
ncbi:MAG: VanW family protein [Actinomycetota bacterium]|nr:VanW family protein [Actinomycetota bacterium]